MINTEELRRDKNALLTELEAAGARIVRPNYIGCPFHEDNRPSAGIYQGEDRSWRFKCHGCQWHGDVLDVRAKATGKTLADVLKDQNQDTHPPKTNKKPPKRIFASIEAVYQNDPRIREHYCYAKPENKKIEMVVFRLLLPDGRKSFLQARSDGNGFVLEAPPKPWPLYNRTRASSAESVIVVEGEKCVHALHELDIVATTSPGGAMKAHLADWSILAGKTVYLWPDADPVEDGARKGIQHMREVQKILESLEPRPRLFWINCDDLGLPPKGDVVDYLDQHVDCDKSHKQQAIEAVLQDAEPTGASREVLGLFHDIIEGRRRSIEWPWTMVTNLTKALLPGTLTLLCGDPGSSKSFFLLEALAHWHEKGIKVAVFELEESRQYHLYRALAQRCGDSQLFNDDHVAANPQKAMDLHKAHSDFLDSFGSCIHEAPDKQVALIDVLKWIETMAANGRRIIAVDPITIASVSENCWIDDLSFIVQSKRVARQFETSIILVTHPKKNHKGSSLDDLAGGAGYARFSQTVMWLQQHEPPKEIKVNSSFGPFEHEVNRTLALRKCRNGPGGGSSIGFDFDGRTLRSVERGLVIKEK